MEDNLLELREKVLKGRKIRPKKKVGRRPINKEKGAMTLLERHAKWRAENREHYRDYQRVYHRLRRRQKRQQRNALLRQEREGKTIE